MPVTGTLNRVLLPAASGLVTECDRKVTQPAPVKRIRLHGAGCRDQGGVLRATWIPARRHRQRSCRCSRQPACLSTVGQRQADPPIRARSLHPDPRPVFPRSADCIIVITEHDAGITNHATGGVDLFLRASILIYEGVGKNLTVYPCCTSIRHG